MSTMSKKKAGECRTVRANLKLFSGEETLKKFIKFVKKKGSGRGCRREDKGPQ